MQTRFPVLRSTLLRSTLLRSIRSDTARRPLAFVLLGLTLAAGALFAQSKKPDFSGEWKTEADKSTRADVTAETIDHSEPKVVITTTPTNGSSFSVRLTTDGKDNLNIIGGREMTAQTKWEGEKLVTLIRDPHGMQFIEVRSLSQDGREQTVEGFMDPSRNRAMFRRVMVKQ
jgi:hypothetical protein